MAEAGATLGARLRQIREQRGFEVRQLALLAGVPASTISQLETGERSDLRGESIRKLAIALEVSADWLLGLTDKETLDPELTGVIEIRTWQPLSMTPPPIPL